MVGAQGRPIWAEGRAIWAEGRAIWAEGRAIWAEGQYQPAPENTVNWQSIGLESASGQATLLGEGITVAVIDTGVDLTHPAFEGAIDTAQAVDLIDGDNVPQEVGSYRTDAAYGHGTGVAGVILQIAPRAKILPIRALNPDGSGDATVVTEAIVYAVDHGADIINLSLGSAEALESVRGALSYAASHGVIVVAAAGNTNSGQVHYPARDLAAGSLDGAGISVASVNTDGVKSDFSNYGDVEILAPGERIYSPFPEGYAAYFSGTSFSTPVIAGALALAKAQNPQATPEQLENALGASARAVDLNSENSPYAGQLGHGMLDLEALFKLP
nr:S8 family serine peptidase [Deinobacterium chartae]